MSSRKKTSSPIANVRRSCLQILRPSHWSIYQGRRIEVDALANLATALALSQKETTKVTISQRWVVPLVVEEEEEEQANIISVCLVEKEDWWQAIIEYLQHGRLPDDIRHKIEVRRRAARFIYYKDTLFHFSFDGLFLHCLKEEAKQFLEEAYSGICGTHQSGPKLHYRIKRMGYYWPTMVQDSMENTKKYKACQYHANFIYQPPEPLHPTIASWPFDAWELDAIGPLPKSSSGHLYILATTDYFSKWAKAIPLREVKKETGSISFKLIWSTIWYPSLYHN